MLRGIDASFLFRLTRCVFCVFFSSFGCSHRGATRHQQRIAFVNVALPGFMRAVLMLRGISRHNSPQQVLLARVPRPRRHRFWRGALMLSLYRRAHNRTRALSASDGRWRNVTQQTGINGGFMTSASQ